MQLFCFAYSCKTVAINYLPPIVLSTYTVYYATAAMIIHEYDYKRFFFSPPNE